MLDVPPQLLEELEQTRQFQHQLDGRLARIERLLTQLTQGGAMLNLTPLLEDGMGGCSSAAREGRAVQSIESNDDIAGRLGFETGISL